MVLEKHNLVIHVLRFGYKKLNLKILSYRFRVSSEFGVWSYFATTNYILKKLLIGFWKPREAPSIDPGCFNTVNSSKTQCNLVNTSVNGMWQFRYSKAIDQFSQVSRTVFPNLFGFAAPLLSNEDILRHP